MKDTKLALVLIRAIPAFALTAPFVIFGVIYLFAVQPAHQAQQAARAQTETLRGELMRMQSLVRNAPVVEVVAQLEFEMRTPSEDRAPEVGEAITGILSGPAVGGVSHLSIESGDAVQPGSPASGAVDPRVGLFHAQVAYTPITVTFDARYAQVGRFFWNLRTLPSTFELRAVDIEPAPAAPLMRTTLMLFVFKRPVAAHPEPPAAPEVRQVVDLTSTPDWSRDPFARGSGPIAVPAVAMVTPVQQPDPVVHTILFSSQQRSALVDGRIVRVGDRVGGGFVQAIEEEAVVFVTASGQVKRVPMEQPRFRAAKR